LDAGIHSVVAHGVTQSANWIGVGGIAIAVVEAFFEYNTRGSGAAEETQFQRRSTLVTTKIARSVFARALVGTGRADRKKERNKIVEKR